MNSHSYWLGKQEGPNFLDPSNQWGLKPGVLKVSVLGFARAQKTLGLVLKRRQGKQFADIQCGNGNLKSTRGT